MLDVLDGVPPIDRMLVMVQREVGERLAARPGTTAYGIPSVKVAYWATAEVVGTVPARACSCPGRRWSRCWSGSSGAPQPGRRRPTRDRLFALVRAGFGQRRKMLRRSLAGLVDAERLRAGRRRAPRPGPRSSSVEQWGRLAGAPE